MFSGRKEMKIGDALKKVLQENDLEEGVDETKLLQEWENIMGKHICNHTISKRVSQSILYVHLDSAALRHELSYRRDELKKVLNYAVGKEVIKDIVFA